MPGWPNSMNTGCGTSIGSVPLMIFTGCSFYADSLRGRGGRTLDPAQRAGAQHRVDFTQVVDDRRPAPPAGQVGRAPADGLEPHADDGRALRRREQPTTAEPDPLARPGERVAAAIEIDEIAWRHHQCTVFRRGEDSTSASRCRRRAASSTCATLSEEHTSELQSHSFISYAVFCLKKK